MTSIVEYLTHFEHVAESKIHDYRLEGEKQAGPCVQLELHDSENFKMLVKDYARFCWIHHLNTVKLEALNHDELRIALNAFEMLYRR